MPRRATADDYHRMLCEIENDHDIDFLSQQRNLLQKIIRSNN